MEDVDLIRASGKDMGVGVSYATRLCVRLKTKSKELSRVADELQLAPDVIVQEAH